MVVSIDHRLLVQSRPSIRSWLESYWRTKRPWPRSCILQRLQRILRSPKSTQIWRLFRLHRCWSEYFFVNIPIYTNTYAYNLHIVIFFLILAHWKTRSPLQPPRWCWSFRRWFFGSSCTKHIGWTNILVSFDWTILQN